MASMRSFDGFEEFDFASPLAAGKRVTHPVYFKGGGC